MVRPSCSSERSDKCETAVSLLGLIIHMIWSMPWADALLGRRAYGHEGYGFSIAGDEQGWLAISFDLRKCHANPEVRSNHRDELRNTLTTGNQHPGCTRDPTAIRVGDNVRCKQFFQCGGVTFLSGIYESN